MIHIVCEHCEEMISISRFMGRKHPQDIITCPNCQAKINASKQKTWKPGVDAICGYESIKEAIDTSPITFLPALAIHIAKKCAEKKVFRSRGAFIRTMRRVYNEEEEK